MNEERIEISGTVAPEGIAHIKEIIKQAENDGAIATAEQTDLFIDKATELFGSYPEVNTLYFTSDGYAFKTENDARNHARTLKKKFVETLQRA